MAALPFDIPVEIEAEAALLRGRKTVRADHRLRTNEKAIRTQSVILYKNNPKPLLLLTTTVFWYGCLLSVPKHGLRAQRARPLAVFARAARKSTRGMPTSSKRQHS
jgi:hypothetical protein